MAEGDRTVSATTRFRAAEVGPDGAAGAQSSPEVAGFLFHELKVSTRSRWAWKERGCSRTCAPVQRFSVEEVAAGGRRSMHVPIGLRNDTKLTA